VRGQWCKLQAAWMVKEREFFATVVYFHVLFWQAMLIRVLAYSYCFWL
jgi:hypothetical protein